MIPARHHRSNKMSLSPQPEDKVYSDGPPQAIQGNPTPMAGNTEERHDVSQPQTTVMPSYAMMSSYAAQKETLELYTVKLKANSTRIHKETHYKRIYFNTPFHLKEQ